MVSLLLAKVQLISVSFESFCDLYEACGSHRTPEYGRTELQHFVLACKSRVSMYRHYITPFCAKQIC